MARSKKAGGEASTPLIIALVFFILLSVGMGVMYYLANGQVAGEEAKAKEADNKAKAAEKAMREAQDTAKMYRAFFGIAPPDELSYLSNLPAETKEAVKADHGKLLAAVNTKVTEAANKERINFEKFGSGFNLAAIELFTWNWPDQGALPTSPSPAPLVDRAVKLVAERERTVRLAAIELDNARKELADLAAAKKKYTDDTTAAVGKLDAQIKSLSDALVKLEAEKKAEIGNFQTAGSNLIKEQNRVQSKVDEVQDAMKKMTEELTNLRKRDERIQNELNEQMQAKKGAFASNPPHGQIVARRGNGQLVEINIGYADNLKAGQTFKVQPADTRALGLGARKKQVVGPDGRLVSTDEELAKGSIEVVEVLGPNLSSARIVDETDDVRDSILKGDLLYNPLWRKGAKDHVVLYGIFDEDADGVDDIQKVAANLERRGVIVDAYYDLAARKWASLNPKNRNPGPTQNTTYAVAGWRPDPGTSFVASGLSDVITAINAAEADAKAKGAQIIKALRFFPEIGYKLSPAISDDTVNRAAIKFVKEVAVPAGDK